MAEKSNEERWTKPMKIYIDGKLVYHPDGLSAEQDAKNQAFWDKFFSDIPGYKARMAKQKRALKALLGSDD